MQQRKQGYYLLYPSQDTQEVLSEGKNMTHQNISYLHENEQGQLQQSYPAITPQHMNHRGFVASF